MRGHHAGRFVPDFSWNSPSFLWGELYDSHSAWEETHGSESCDLLKVTPTGRRQSQDLVPGLFDAKVFALFPFIWIKFSLLSVNGSNFLSITRLYSSLNNYFKNVVLESRVYVHVCHNLNLQVLCCIRSPRLTFLTWQHPLLVECALPSSNVWESAKCSGCLHFGNTFSRRLSLLALSGLEWSRLFCFSLDMLNLHLTVILSSSYWHCPSLYLNKLWI